MATIEIPDEIIEALRSQAKVRRHSDDPAALVLDLARRHLADVCAPGFDRDPLTGSRTRAGLRDRIDTATRGSTWTDRTAYRERLLCIDLDKFKNYLDVHGMFEGDGVLRFLAEQLKLHFGSTDVYRVGGDEFVVVLGDREPWLPEAPPDVTFAHALVDVAVHRNPERSRHVNRWIEIHLEAGIVTSRPEGNRIDCRDPSWLAQG